MPRKRKSPGSGGARQGTPGQNYPNRSDMTQPVRAASGQTYGSRGEQENAQRSVPLPAPAPPPASPAQGSVTAGPLTPLGAPTTRPDEPLTAGLPMGPGPGPAILGDQRGIGDPLTYLEGLYLKTGLPEIAEMLREARKPTDEAL